MKSKIKCEKKMAELSKFFKIVLIIDILAGLIYGILYLFIPEIYAGLIDPPAFDLHFWRLWGATCTTLGVVGIIGFIRNEWTTFKVIIEFVVLWLILMNIINLISLATIARSPTNLASQWTDFIIIIILIILNIYAYLKENK